jgi:benzylsuccinate CoA-transferase BbsF subunit
MEVYTDFVSSHFNLVAILSALNYRRRTGKGQYLDLSQYENALHFMAPSILENVVNKRVVSRVGNQLPCSAPHGAYRCRGEDRWCAISVFTDEEWKSFCRVIGNPAWTNDPKFATLLTRKDNEEQLNKLVEEWTINYSPEEVTTMMQNEGVPAGTLQTTEDVLDHDPHLKDRHFYWELDHPVMGRHRVWRSSFTLSKSPCELRRAPLLGEHNEHILKTILNMSDDEIADLIINGVIE